MNITPIGTIHTPHTTRENMPIQPAGARGIKGAIDVFDDYAAGLKDLDGFSHIVVLYQFHQSEGYSLEVTPFMDTEKRGVFATRAPRRPNQIGLSVIRLMSVEGNTLHVENVDMLDGTPLLDIKPYVPEFDGQQEVRVGWLEKARGVVKGRRSDGRFGGGSDTRAQGSPLPGKRRSKDCGGSRAWWPDISDDFMRERVQSPPQEREDL